MNRRTFITSLAVPAVLRANPAATVQITRITAAPMQGRFHKFVAMNSYDVAPKGHTYENQLVRIVTNKGVEGIGVTTGANLSPDFTRDLRPLIGADPASLYRIENGRVAGRNPAYQAVLERHAHLDGPLFDLIGKLTGKPVWQLLGEAVRDEVEVYDGTLYFSDVWFESRGVRAVVEEAEEAVRKGYRGMKFKIGRGWKWMEPEAGLKRDIEVLKAVRKAVGRGPKILADANNGYREDVGQASRLLEETRDVNLYWLEEPFPEDVAEYAHLREQIAAAGIKTLIADGENIGDPAAFEPYLRPRRLMDVLQMDIRRGGFLSNREMALSGEPVGAISVPHNWGSQVGLFMGLHMAKAVKSIVAAEDDRSTCDVIIAEGYRFRDGYYSVPDAPGLGIQVDEKLYETRCRPREVVIS